MTNEEAIRCLDIVLNSVNYYEYYYDDNVGYQITKEDIGWLEKAKEAIQKQITEKPMLICGDYDMPICPDCKQFVDDTEFYCSTCGKALNWDE